MSITTSNIHEIYPQLNQKDLPEPIQAEAYQFLTDNFYLYKTKEFMKTFVDVFILKLNEWLTKQGLAIRNNKVIEKTVHQKLLEYKNVQVVTIPKPSPKEEILPEEEAGSYYKMTKQIADTIVEQFGGNGFIQMTGAKDFKISGDKLLFTIGSNAGSCKYVQVKYGYDDYYYLAFLNSAAKVIEDFEAVCWEDLPDLFKQVTGMDTIMPKVKFQTAPEQKNKQPRSKDPEKKKKVKRKNPKYKEGQALYWFDENDFFTLHKEKIEKVLFNESTGEPIYEVTGIADFFYPESQLIKQLSERTLFLKEPATPTEKLAPDVAYIKRYIAMHGKHKTKEQVLSLLKSLQKAILERSISKDSTYSDEIEEVQNQLISCIKKMGASAAIEIDAKRLEHYKSIVNSWGPMLSVSFLKQYVRLIGKSNGKGKAEQLASRIAKATAQKKILATDRYAKQLDNAYCSLQKYIDSKDSILNISKTELNGLEGLGFVGSMVAGVVTNLISNALDRKIQKSAMSGVQLVNSVELAGMEFETLALTGAYQKLIGTPSSSFTVMVYGVPGGGKTTFCLQFAKHLAQLHHLKVLFATIEEGINHTVQEKVNRLGVAHPNLSIASYLPENLAVYNAVVIDSINSFRLSVEELRDLRNRYPQTIFIYIFQTTKEGKFRGNQEFEHDVDVVIKAENGTVTTEGCKNRFGGSCTLNVYSTS